MSSSSRSRRRRAAAALAAVAASALVAVPAAAATPPTPRPPVALPTAVEPPTPYVGQVACDPAGKPGAVALGKLLTATYPGTTYGIDRPCGNGGTVSEHYEGRAVDWMVRADRPEQKAQAEGFLAWLLAPDATGAPAAMARRLGVMYVIWDKRQYGVHRAGEGWRPYACSDVTSCHSDHVHLSLSWDGAYARTSFWTGRVASGTDFGPCRPADLNWAPRYRSANPTRCPSQPRVTAPPGMSPVVAGLVRFGGAELAQGSRGAAVSALQAGLGVPADGMFGPGTAAAVRDVQRRRGLAVTGVADAPTWRALLAAGNRPPAVPAPPAPVPTPAPARPAPAHPAPAHPGPAAPAPADPARASAIAVRLQALGAARAGLGVALGPESPTPDRVGRYQVFQGASVYWSPRTGARIVKGAIREAWGRVRWEAGPLGYPVTDELRAPDGVGRYSHFERGSAYWSPPTGAHEVYGAIRDTWSALGWERSRLGYPTSGEYSVPGGRAGDFQHGRIVWDAATGRTRVESR